jgi:hypothetical protein
MKSTKFKITVSGAPLKSEQVAQAAAQMNAALLTALVGMPRHDLDCQELRGAVQHCPVPR